MLNVKEVCEDLSIQKKASAHTVAQQVGAKKCSFKPTTATIVSCAVPWQTTKVWNLLLHELLLRWGPDASV